MSLNCAISNEVPEHPVISPISGCVFERRLIEKYVNETGLDPVNGEKLSIDQLISIKAPPLVKPRPPTATSIPAILKMFQDEWDAVMLHNFTLKQQLQTARQELSHSLYQHDAACRVIARLTKEVTAAREALATLKPHTTAAMMPVAGGQPQMQQVQAPAQENNQMMVVDEAVEVAEITEDIIQKLQDKATLLTAERKKRGKTIPEGLATPEDIQKYNVIGSQAGLHSASMPGILALDICLRDSSKIVTGGVDKNAAIFNKDSGAQVATLQGHTKKVTNVIYHPVEDLVFTGSQDQTIRVWGVQRSSPCAHVIRPHDGPITGLSLHATGDYLLSCSSDGAWAFSDIRVGRVLAKVVDPASNQTALTCAKFHPDGLILGTGLEDSLVKIWDLKEKTNVASFSGHQGPITALAFSENGYYLATAADDAVVKLWDLRKLKNFKNIALEDKYEVKSLNFDQSGTYLAVAGTDVRVYLCKQWLELVAFNKHTAMATGVCFGNNASFIASVSMDRTLKLYGLD
ncbi:hypothetical protein HELRODRAFT_186274 [Helobdella robusta]|uniref:Pre-mRNA-processing factor 19 n=1 Tax=Helobdella robusta TaxID=6412 RepID=T1FNW4_HELRO|nr:hypothetical protein HELRODRAFT_186274 [Helobdella robusta]ESO10400.1 hypothetical protein HELRODRAFT_186274 [Helobdella robusta]